MIEQLVAYPIGSRVRVVHGKLAGLTGMVVRLTDDELNCVLTIDGWVRGAYLAVSGDALESQEESGHQLCPFKPSA